MARQWRISNVKDTRKIYGIVRQKTHVNGILVIELTVFHHASLEAAAVPAPPKASLVLVAGLEGPPAMGADMMAVLDVLEVLDRLHFDLHAQPTAPLEEFAMEELADQRINTLEQR